MELQKIANFLNTASDDKDLPRFVTKKWIEVYAQSEKSYNPIKEIRIKTSKHCKRNYYCCKTKNTNRNKATTFKNNAPFVNCTSKINGVKFDNAEDLDVVMPMYNLLEYSKNY